MTTRTAHSTKDTVEAVTAELATQLKVSDPKLVVYFASPRFDPAELAASMQRAFGTATFGCTTAGEIVSGRMLQGSVVALSLDADLVHEAHVVAVADHKDPQGVDRALSTLSDRIGRPLNDLGPEWVGLVLHDGLSVAEETVMERLSDLTNVPFVGGSAGDDAKFERTHVFVNGEALTGASALALLRTTRPAHILKTQSFDVLDEILEVTDVDEATRTVRAFNGRPAAEAYAGALGVPAEELSKHFQDHPVGLVLDGEPFVRSPQQGRGTDVVFYCQVKQGMRLNVLRSRSIVEDTHRDLEEKLAEIGRPRAVINFHCILRTLELQAKGQMDAYGKLFEQHPTIGFSTYGESYIGHINQTSTILLLT